jgi:hypothetical protein
MDVRAGELPPTTPGLKLMPELFGYGVKNG